MNSTRLIIIGWLGFGVALSSAGCGSKSTGGATGQPVGSSGAATSNAEDASGIKRYPADTLPAVDYNLSPLDNGRLEVPAPIGWKAGARQAKMIVWFHVVDKKLGDPSGLPRIVVTGDTSKLEGVTTVSSANVADIAKSLTTKFGEAEEKVLELPRALMLGDNAWVRYLLPGRFKGAAIDRQVLMTVVDGREYLVELQVNAGTVMKHRDHAYAIAAGMKFHKPDAAAVPDSTPEAPPPVKPSTPEAAK